MDQTQTTEQIAELQKQIAAVRVEHGFALAEAKTWRDQFGAHDIDAMAASLRAKLFSKEIADLTEALQALQAP